MATVSGIQRDSWSFKRDEDGDTLTYSLLVSDLSSTGTAAVKEALTATGVPAIGDRSSEFDSLRLVEIQPKPEAPDVVRLALTFRGESSLDSTQSGVADNAKGRIITFSTSTVRKQVNTDTNGNVLSVSYVGSDNQTRTQAGTVDVFEPVGSLTIRVPSYMNPKRHADYVGSVNRAVVSLADNVRVDIPGTTYYGTQMDVGFWSGQLLFSGINGNSDGWGSSWDLEYQFLIDYGGGSGWNAQTIYYRDPQTGRPPPDVSTSNGITTAFNLYPLMDFDILGIWDEQWPPKDKSNPHFRNE